MRFIYLDLDLNIATARAQDATHCAQCGMAMLHQAEYHPFAACLIFKACRDGQKVRENLGAVIDHVRERDARSAARHAALPETGENDGG